MKTYYAELTTRYMQGPVDHWTYVYAKDEADARWQLERGGHEVRVLRAVASGLRKPAGTHSPRPDPPGTPETLRCTIFPCDSPT